MWNVVNTVVQEIFDAWTAEYCSKVIMERIQGKLFHKFFTNNEPHLERFDDRPGVQEGVRQGGDPARTSHDAKTSEKIPTAADLDPAVFQAIASYAAEREIPVAEAIAEAVSRFVASPGDAARNDAVEKRLDSVARAVTRLERDQAACAEILGQFVKFWSAANPVAPEAMRGLESGHVPEQYDAFLDSVGRKLASGQTVTKEMANRTGYLKRRPG